MPTDNEIPVVYSIEQLWNNWGDAMGRLVGICRDETSAREFCEDWIEKYSDCEARETMMYLQIDVWAPLGNTQTNLRGAQNSEVARYYFDPECEEAVRFRGE
jgi:hypothetical protein